MNYFLNDRYLRGYENNLIFLTVKASDNVTCC